MSSRTRQFRGLVALTVILTAGLTACDDGSLDIADDASVSVVMTDAPGDVERVWVDVEQIYLQGGEEGRVDLLTESTGLIELTALVGTSVDLVVGRDVDVGTFGQLRFVLGGAVLEAQDGEVYVFGEVETLPDGLVQTGNLQCPSCGQSGIKVIVPREDEGDEEEVLIEPGDNLLVLDWDVGETFGHSAGQSGMWVMRPVVHGARLLTDVELGLGRITGEVVLGAEVTVPSCPVGTARDLTDFEIVLTAGTLVDDDGMPLVRTATVNNDGTFTVGFLPADTWTISTQSRIDLLGFDLVFDATVEPSATLVVEEGAVVEDVLITIDAANCVADV